MARATGEKKPVCLIDINLAYGINHLLYAMVGKHDNVKAHRFLCPKCQQPVEPVKTARKSKKQSFFRHVEKSECPGHESWR